MGYGIVGHVFGEVGLDHGDAHLEQLAVLGFEPLDGLRVGEVDRCAWFGETVDESQAPTLPSPRRGGGNGFALHQEATALAFGSHLRVERHVWAHPQAEAKSKRL